MGSTDPAVRQPLLDEQLEWQKANVVYGAAAKLWAGVGTTVGGAGAALGVTQAIAAGAGSFIPVAVLTLIAVRARYRDVTIEHRLNDPPRLDFETSTHPRRRSFRPEALGDTPLERAAKPFLMAALMADARMEASVRAEERALGARESGRPDLAIERESEARRFVREGALLQMDIERRAVTLSIQLAALEPPPASRPQARLADWSSAQWTQPLAEGLPEPVIDLLLEAGVLARDLFRPARAAPPRGFASRDEAVGLLAGFDEDPGRPLMVAGAQSGESARALRASTGIPEKRTTPPTRAEQELLDEVAETEPLEIPAARSAEEPPPPSQWQLDIEPDAGGYRWLLRQPDGRVVAASTKRFGSRADALVGARDSVARSPRFEFYEVGPSRFEWQAVDRRRNPIAQGRVPYRSREAVQRAMSDARENLPRARIVD